MFTVFKCVLSIKYWQNWAYVEHVHMYMCTHMMAYTSNRFIETGFNSPCAGENGKFTIIFSGIE